MREGGREVGRGGEGGGRERESEARERERERERERGREREREARERARDREDTCFAFIAVLSPPDHPNSLSLYKTILQAWVHAIKNAVRAAEDEFQRSLQLSRAQRFRRSTREVYDASLALSYVLLSLCV